LDFKKVILEMPKERQYVLYGKVHKISDIAMGDHLRKGYDSIRKEIKIIYQKFGWTEWSKEEKHLHLETDIKPIIDKIVAENPDILSVVSPPPTPKVSEKPVVPFPIFYEIGWYKYQIEREDLNLLILGASVALIIAIGIAIALWNYSRLPAFLLALILLGILIRRLAQAREE
jgi:hypothetical protein